MMKVNVRIGLFTMLLLFSSGAKMAFSYTAPDKPPFNLGWVPLGGMGVGQIEINGAGKFTGIACSERDSSKWPTNKTVCPFILFTSKNDSIYKTVLQERAVDIDYVGFYPKATLTYTKPAMPVILVLKAFSPMIPGDDKNCSLPLAMFEFTITNNQEVNVDAALAFNWNTRWTTAGKSTQAEILDDSNNKKGLNFNFKGGSHTTMVINDGSATTSYGAKKSDFTTDGILGNIFKGNSCMLASKITLRPGESRKICFVLAWHKAEMILDGQAEGFRENKYVSSLAKDEVLSGRSVGFRHTAAPYNFTTAQLIAEYGYSYFSTLLAKVEAWHQKIFDSNFPEWYQDMLINSLYILSHNAIWAEDNRFTVMEEAVDGPMCGTIDQRYHCGIGTIFFSPEADYGEMKLCADSLISNTLVTPNVYGAVPHDFGVNCINMPNPGTGCGCNYPIGGDSGGALVLHSLRNYMWTGDLSKLKVNYPGIKDTIKFMRNNDIDTRKGDYLVDDHGATNTYDVGGLWGSSAYSAEIQLASYKAGMYMAALFNETTWYNTLNNWYKQGSETFEKTVVDGGLWEPNNGYYINWISDTGNNMTCITGMLSGTIMADMLYLGKIHDQSRINQAIDRIYKTNLANRGIYNGRVPETGQFWPPSECSCPSSDNEQWPGYNIAQFSAYAASNDKIDMALEVAYRTWKGLFKDYPRVWDWPCKSFGDNGEGQGWGNHAYMNSPGCWNFYYNMTGLCMDKNAKKFWLAPRLPLNTTYMSNNTLIAPIFLGYTTGMFEYRQYQENYEQKLSITMDSPVEVEKFYIKLTTGPNRMNIKVVQNGKNIIPVKVSTVDNNLIECTFEPNIYLSTTPIIIYSGL